MFNTLKLDFIGGGNMVTALIGGPIAKSVHGVNVVAMGPTEPTHNRAEQIQGVRTTTVPGAELADRDVIVLVIKPQQVHEVCAQLASHLRDSLVLSVTAGIHIQDLSRWLNDHAHMIQVMLSTPALSGLGATGLAANAGLSDGDRAIASAVTNAVGKSIQVSTETQIDAVTAISGSDPTYVSYSAEAIQQMVRELGLSAEDGRTLAIETSIDMAMLAGQSTEPVEMLHGHVTFKGGTIYAALTSMEGVDIKAAFMQTIYVVATWGKEVGERFGQD